MASFSLVDCTIFAAGYDFTTDANQLSVNTEVEDLESTTFGGNGWRSRKGGLKSAEASLEGFWDSAPDEEIFDSLGARNEAVTFTPDGAEGAVSYSFQAGKFSYEALGEVGALAPFSLSMMGTEGTGGLVRGRLAAAKGDVSATGVAGAAVNLGSISSSQYLYATVHLFSVGTSITIDVESDDASGFSAPTTQATIGPLTATGGTWMIRVAGPITDTWWRFNVTDISGTFTLAGAIGIQ